MTNGICALICLGETKNSGMVWPFTSTDVPSSTVGKGVPVVLLTLEDREFPNTATIMPGATAGV